MKIKSIALRTAAEHVAQGPKTIRLYTNKPSLTFDDVEGGSAALQEIELTEEQVREGARVPLRFVRFQNVTSLHVSVLLASDGSAVVGGGGGAVLMQASGKGVQYG